MLQGSCTVATKALYGYYKGLVLSVQSPCSLVVQTSAGEMMVSGVFLAYLVHIFEEPAVQDKHHVELSSDIVFECRYLLDEDDFPA